MANNYKYNSQSLEQNEFTDNNGDSYGLDWYNFAARNYDPQLGRWLQPDPLMQHPSPYLAMSNNPISYTDPLGLSDLEVELNPVTIYASKPDWMRFGMDSNMDYAMAMGMAGWDDRPKPITNFEKQNWLTYNNPDEGTFWGRAFNADNYYGANEGGITFKQARSWYQFAGGAPMNLNINTIDFSRVSMSEMNGKLIEVNLDNPFKHMTNINDALVYGTLYLYQENGNVFRAAHVNEINGRGDNYNFDVKWFSPKEWLSGRNENTILGGLINGLMPIGGSFIYVGGTPYPIYLHGTITIKP